MNPFEMVVTIVAICVIGSVIRARFQARGTADDTPRRDATETALRDELAALKRRVATLERIATDRSTALDHEIEALRDRS